MKVYELLETLDIKADGNGWRIWDTTKKEFAPTGKFATAGEAEEARDKLKKSGYKSSSNNKTTKNTQPSAKKTTTTSSSTKTTKVPVQYDPSIPTRDKLTRGQVKQMARTGKVTVGGKTFTKKQIAKNTALNKTRLLALTKDPSKTLSKAAKKEIGGAYKKSSGYFAKGAPPVEPPNLRGRVMQGIGKILKGFRWISILKIITIVQFADILEKYALSYWANGCSYNVNDNPNVGNGRADSQKHVADMDTYRLEMGSVISAGMIATVLAAASNFQKFRKLGALVGLVALVGPGTQFAGILNFVISVGLSSVAIYVLTSLAKKTAAWNYIGARLSNRFFNSEAMTKYMEFIVGSYCNEGHDFSYKNTIVESEDAGAVSAAIRDLKSDPKFMKAYKILKKKAKSKQMATSS